MEPAEQSMVCSCLRHDWCREIIMEEPAKYGSSTVLLTNVTAGKEKSNEVEEFPCISPLDDGELELLSVKAIQPAVDRKLSLK